LPNQTEKRSFQVTLAAELLHGFMHLFESAVRTSGWGMIENPNPANTDETFPGNLMKQVPPTYLN
jgi:hypothetical protein